jgi:sugar/nucleoside kinase (ribokinase family)
MNNRTGILGAGNWIVDYVKVIDAWPSQDTLANISSEYRGTGGSPCNLLIDLAKLGADFPLIGAGTIGEDEPGDWILETCKSVGVDTELIRRQSDQPTSYTDVMTVASTGRRTFFHQRGANALFDIDAISLEICRAKIFHLGYLLLLDRLDQPSAKYGTRAAELLQMASELGFITTVDVVSEESDRFARILLPALPFLDIIFLNELEAGQALSTKIRQGDQIDIPVLVESAKRLLAAGVRHWVAIFRKVPLPCHVAGSKYFNRASKCLLTRSPEPSAQATRLPPVFYWDTTKTVRWRNAWPMEFAPQPRRCAIRALPGVWKISTPVWHWGINLVTGRLFYKSITRRWTNLSQ